jgi:hypothetical protein
MKRIVRGKKATVKTNKIKHTGKKKTAVKTHHNIKVTKLDKLFSEYVRLLSGGYCKICGKKFKMSQLNCCHFFSRKNKTVRWNILIAVCGCVGCHFTIDQDPIKKYEFFRGLMSKKEFEELNRIAHLTIKDYPIDMEKLEQEFKEGIKKLQ